MALANHSQDGWNNQIIYLNQIIHQNPMKTSKRIEIKILKNIWIASQVQQVTQYDYQP